MNKVSIWLNLLSINYLNKVRLLEEMSAEPLFPLVAQES